MPAIVIALQPPHYTYLFDLRAINREKRIFKNKKSIRFVRFAYLVFIYTQHFHYILLDNNFAFLHRNSSF